MKLLDQNLSPRLVRSLGDVFPGSLHVRSAGLEAADDHVVWEYAMRHGFVIVSKDSDFHQRSLVFGHPPKVIWVRLGNCSTADIERLLRHYETTIRTFDANPEGAFLGLSW